MHGILYYSTISGNTRLVGEALVELFQKSDITLLLQDVAVDTTWQEDIDFALFGSGTYGHGMIEKSLRKFLEEILKEKKLRHIPYAAIGLGDHRYDREYNVYAADQIELWIQEHGGTVMTGALKINRSPLKVNNQKIIENWGQNFITTLQKL